MSIVYIGDSWTDFECLLAADLGICTHDDPPTSTQRKLMDSFQRVGVHCPHMQDLKEADDWGVVWAEDFTEILQWARRLDEGLEWVLNLREMRTNLQSPSSESEGEMNEK